MKIENMDNVSGICYKMNEYDLPIIESSLEKMSRSNASGGNCGSRRKMQRWDTIEGGGPNRSTGSLLTTMEKFVQVVEEMNETILVPCRLMDAKFNDSDSSCPKTITSNGSSESSKLKVLNSLNGVDLYGFYTILNSVKSDLMWGNSTNNNSTSGENSKENCGGVGLALNNGTNGTVKRHVRRPSTVSTTSSSSASVSDTDFSELNDDSGVEGEEEGGSGSIADNFHHHLSGLQQCLKDLTLAADYLTNRYNNDLGGGLI